MKIPPWLFDQNWFLFFARPAMRFGQWLGKLLQQLEKPKMFKIAVVGDLSLQDPKRLERAMDAAAAACPDVLIHVGDIQPGWAVLKKYKVPILAVPGNHDADWDSSLGWPRSWFKDFEQVQIVGMDNSQDRFVQADWDNLTKAVPGKLLIVVCHKALSTIVFPDGTISQHVMGEGQPNADADRLKGWCMTRRTILIHGHFHGLSLMQTSYGLCLVEGRGGAAPEIGYTIVYVSPDGVSFHPATA
jgi:predicted phosphodiesterase